MNTRRDTKTAHTSQAKNNSQEFEKYIIEIFILLKGFSDLTGEEVEFGSFPKLSSAEYVEYRRGEAVSLFGASHHLASSLNRLVDL